MAKPGIKDPSVSQFTRAVRLMFRRPVAGVVGSALMVRFAGGHMEKALSSSIGVDGPVGQAVALVGASAIGYGLGFGTMVALKKLRRELIAYLLTYKSWIFEQTSTKTKVDFVTFIVIKYFSFSFSFSSYLLFIERLAF